MTTTPLALSTSSSATTPHRSSRAAWLGFLVVASASVMNMLDATITQTAAPAIRRELGASYAGLEWISAIYTLSMSVTLLPGGRLGDILGRRRCLLSAIAGFIATSMLCALAVSPTMLIVARAIQGATAGIMLSQGYGLIRELFGDDGQRKAFSVLGPAIGIAAIAGPLVGGGLIKINLVGTGWRTIFAVNGPLGIAALLAGHRLLPHIRPATPDARPDQLSIALALLGAVAVVYPLIDGRQDGWPTWSWLVLAAGIMLLAAFAGLQRHRSRTGRTPLVEPSILRRRGYLVGLGIIVGFFGAMAGMTLAVNVIFQIGFGLSPLACALATIAVPISTVAGSITSSALPTRSARTTIQIGIVTMAAGLLAIAVILHSTRSPLSRWTLTAPLAVTGYGMGLVFVPLFDVILAGTPERQLGSVTGLLQSVQQLAMAIGIAVAGTQLFQQPSHVPARVAIIKAAPDTLLATVAMLVSGAAASLCLARRQ